MKSLEKITRRKNKARSAIGERWRSEKRLRKCGWRDDNTLENGNVVRWPYHLKMRNMMRGDKNK